MSHPYHPAGWKTGWMKRWYSLEWSVPRWFCPNFITLGDAPGCPRSKRQADIYGAWCKTPTNTCLFRFFCFDMAFKVIQLKVVKMGIQMIVEKQNCEMIVIFENAHGSWMIMDDYMIPWIIGMSRDDRILWESRWKPENRPAEFSVHGSGCWRDEMGSTGFLGFWVNMSWGT